MNKEDRMKKMMKLRKKDLVTMMDLVMQENKNWELEYNKIEVEYEKLLAWKNVLKSRLSASPFNEKQ